MRSIRALANARQVLVKAATKYPSALILLTMAIVYVPFLGKPLLRTAGDEKVYVAQALEMARKGHWFLQTLADQPNYYKGPFHYIALRLGMLIFPAWSMWATLYMNLCLIALGALALAAIVRRRMPRCPGWDAWAGMAFALSAGVYAHLFASQMEAELCGIYAICLWCADGTVATEEGVFRPSRSQVTFEWLFWLAAGVAGWMKSPVHALLLGLSLYLFWALIGEWPQRFRRARTYCAPLVGIVVCAAGYAPAFFGDRAAFLATYVGRETFGKVPNGVAWYMAIIPLFTQFLMPWLLCGLVAFVGAWRGGKKRNEAIALRLSAAFVVPTLAFFSAFPFRGQIYALPAVSALIIALTVEWQRTSSLYFRAYRRAMRATALLFLVLPVALSFAVARYAPMPTWWPSWLLSLVWCASCLTLVGAWRAAKDNRQAPLLFALALVPIYVSFGCVMASLGEHEVVGLKAVIEAYRATTGRDPVVGYDNALPDATGAYHQNTWSEWGYLSFWAHYPIKGLHTAPQLRQALLDGALVIVPGQDDLPSIERLAAELRPGKHLSESIWPRWRTHGQDPQGQPLWRKSLRLGDLSLLEQPFYIVQLPKPSLSGPS